MRPSDGRLTEADRETFRGAYCGLCHTLGRRYGLVGRMILNYDLTFLAMVLSRGTGETCDRRCAVHPFRKRRCAAGDPAFNTAADMSVILTWWQLRDGVADHGFFRGLKYRLAVWLLTPAYRKARRCREDFDRQTEAHLTQLSALEKARCPSLDAPADAFASLLAGAAAGWDSYAPEHPLQNDRCGWRRRAGREAPSCDGAAAVSPGPVGVSHRRGG